MTNSQLPCSHQMKRYEGIDLVSEALNEADHCGRHLFFREALWSM
jgi:hypothetical protein